MNIFVQKSAHLEAGVRNIAKIKEDGHQETTCTLDVVEKHALALDTPRYRGL
jgi:hypothetical protein